MPMWINLRNLVTLLLIADECYLVFGVLGVLLDLLFVHFKLRVELGLHPDQLVLSAKKLKTSKNIKK